MSSDVTALHKYLVANDTRPRSKGRRSGTNASRAANNRDLHQWLSELSSILNSNKSGQKNSDNVQGGIELSRTLLVFCFNSRSPFSIRQGRNRRQLDRTEHVVRQVSRILKSVKTLAKTSHLLSVLFRSYSISNIPSFTFSSPQMEVSGLTIKGMVERMLDDRSQVIQYEEAITELEVKNTLSNITNSEGNKWHPKTHAEILVAEFFCSRRLEFFADDPFIAYSKAACYCCYFYLKDHPGHFVVPASSYNAYIRWALPEDPRLGLAEYRDEFWRNTTKLMREEILEDLAGRRIKPIIRGDSL